MPYEITKKVCVIQKSWNLDHMKNSWKDSHHVRVVKLARSSDLYKLSLIITIEVNDTLKRVI